MRFRCLFLILFAFVTIGCGSESTQNKRRQIPFPDQEKNGEKQGESADLRTQNRSNSFDWQVIFDRLKQNNFDPCKMQGQFDSPYRWQGVDCPEPEVSESPVTSENPPEEPTKDNAPEPELGEEDLEVMPPKNGQKIALPIRVFSSGAATKVEREIPLPNDTQWIQKIDKLKLTVHRPSYRFRSNAIKGSLQAGEVTPEAKSYVQINNGDKIQLIESESTRRLVVGKKSEMYGGLGGGFHTNAVTIRVEDDLKSGSNTLIFGFNGHKKETVGYRIVSIDFLDEGGNSLINQDDYFYQEDPSKSQDFAKDIGNAADGKRNWEGFKKDADGNWQRHKMDLYPGAPKKIIASCASCHANDGGDLQYFAYSNEVIYKRAQFHGFTLKEGKDIAAYIRSHPSEMYGRPWNPPYQPGPGLDANSEAWAAGAGLQAVLESDLDMAKSQELFGAIQGTPSVEDIEKIFDVDGTLNVRQLPIAIQLPDWNAWLPEFHPLDHFNKNGYDFKSSRPFQHYAGLVNPKNNGMFIGTPIASQLAI